MVSFLIEQNIWDEESLLLEILKSKNIPYYLHPYTDFDPGFVPHNISTIFCYGSLEWISQIQKHDSPNLLTLCTLQNFDCREYYKYFEEYLFNRFRLFIPFSQFVSDGHYILADYNGKVFMRPAVGNKPDGITGGIWTKEYFDENIDQIKLEPTDVVLLSEVKHIEYEWRTIVSSKQCITGCQYKSYDQQTQRLGVDPTSYFPERVSNFVNEVIQKINWCPDDIFVIDIVESNGEKLSIMEINALSTSGWYDCDIGRIIEEIALLEKV